MTNPDKPFAPACERNQDPILDVLRVELADTSEVLEIGSGTGQHAVYFAAALPHLVWHASDRAENHGAIKAWLADADGDNLRGPHELDVTQDHWPLASVDAVFSANAVHIMSWPCVEAMIAGVGRVLTSGGKLCLYGPFKYGGNHTSESNVRFDGWLYDRDPLSAVRDVDDLAAIARPVGLTLQSDLEMPANNRLLVWLKQ